MKDFVSSFFEDQSEDLIRKAMSKPARCRSCINLNYNHIEHRYEHDHGFFCGLHGCAPVDPDGFQKNLDLRGSCGYSPKVRLIQLTFDF